MARLFTIIFKYLGKNYIAVVFEANQILKITFHDESLQVIIPGGEFSYCEIEKIVKEPNFSPAALALSEIIITSIETQKSRSCNYR